MLNEEYEETYEFIPFNEERVLFQTRRRNLKILEAEENGRVLGLIGTHSEERGEKNIRWLAAGKVDNRTAIENMLVEEVEKRTEGDTVTTMVDKDSPRITDWVNGGYVLELGYQRMSAKLNGLKQMPAVPMGIKLRSARVQKFRSKHLGSALTARSMNFLLQRGMTSVRLGTSEKNVSSIALLCSLGFQVDNVRKILRKKLKKTRLDAVQCILIALGLLENTSRLLLFSSSVGIASPSPSLLLVKVEARTNIFSLFDHMFLEACATVDRFVYGRLKRHQGNLAAITTLSLKHPFLERIKSPRLAPD